MGRNVEALKALYIALGGDADDVADIVTIDAMIFALATLASEGLPNTLPSVAAKDNGKIMKVVDGEWALASDATE